MSVPPPPDEDTGVMRLQDTAELRAVEGAPPPGYAPPAPGPPEPPPGWARPDNPWPWLLLVLLVVAGILVWLFLFHGRSNRHAVPRVVGLRQPAAFAVLNRAGFDAKAVQQPSRSPRGVVFAQKPGAGAQLKKGQTVTVDVASGVAPPAAHAKAPPAKTTTVAKTKVAVPGVTGKPLADAGAAVAAAGLVPDSAPAQGGGAPGTVTAQTPGAGVSVAAGSAVELTVAQGSGGAAVAVPNVTGQTAADALSKLWAARLTARTLYRSGKAGVVLQQQPGPGQAPAYTQVTLYVGR